MKKGLTIPGILLIASLVIGVAGYFAGKTQTFGAMPTETAFFEDSLGSKMTASQTTMTLYRGTFEQDDSSLSGTYGFVIDEGGTNQEVVVCTCTGTACSSCLRGISDFDGQTEITGNKKAHRRGDSVKMTDHPSLIRMIRMLNGTDAVEEELYYDVAPTTPSSTAIVARSYIDSNFASTGGTTFTGAITTTDIDFIDATSTIADIQNQNLLDKTASESITGLYTFSNSNIPALDSYTAPTLDAEFAPKKYVDDIAISGSPTSSTSTAGIVFMSTDPANANIPIAVGDNDSRFDTYLTTSTYTETFTAGENLSEHDAVYLKDSDGKVYKCSTSTPASTIGRFVGLTYASASADAEVLVWTHGVATGFSGLTQGAWLYHGNTDGSATTTELIADNTYYYIGKAITTTSVLVQPTEFYGSFATSATTTTYLVDTNASGVSTTSTSYVKLKETQVDRAVNSATIEYTYTDDGGVGDVYARLYKNGVALGTEKVLASGAETWSEHFADEDFVAGDLIQVYGKITGGDGVTITDLKIYYELQTTDREYVGSPKFTSNE